MKTLFKIEVYSPNGLFIKEAMINDNHDFYCSGLVPGQKYMIVFSRNEALLLIADFMCDTSGRVVYLSPGHFIFNNGISAIPPKAGNDLASKVKRREELKVPHQQWEKKIIENVAMSGKINDNALRNTHKVVCFKAGAVLAKAVK
jgi:hypothetical protein